MKVYSKQIEMNMQGTEVSTYHDVDKGPENKNKRCADIKNIEQVLTKLRKNFDDLKHFRDEQVRIVIFKLTIIKRDG